MLHFGLHLHSAFCTLQPNPQAKRSQDEQVVWSLGQRVGGWCFWIWQMLSVSPERPAPLRISLT